MVLRDDAIMAGNGESHLKTAHDYLRRCGNREDWEELSEAEKVEDNGTLT